MLVQVRAQAVDIREDFEPVSNMLPSQKSFQLF